jgi:hypothetical protein
MQRSHGGKQMQRSRERSGFHDRRVAGCSEKGQRRLAPEESLSSDGLHEMSEVRAAPHADVLTVVELLAVCGVDK